MIKSILTNSVFETKKSGEILAKKILRNKTRKRAVVFGLEGELGSGKTTFLQGFAKGLKINEKVLSPTFIIMRKFEIQDLRKSQNFNLQIPKFKTFYHIDCYRIKNQKEILNLGFKKIISNPQNIVGIEWAERIKKILPRELITIKFKIINKNKRKINF